MKVKELSTPLATAMRLVDEYADKLVFNHSQKWKTGESQDQRGVEKSRDVLKSYLKKHFSSANVVQS